MTKIFVMPNPNMPINSVKDLIDNLFRHPYSNERSEKARATFYDAECTTLQCIGARRSFEDLLSIAQTYFPETTELDLMRVLKSLKIQMYFCDDVRKIVFHFIGGFDTSINNFPKLAISRPYVNGTYTKEQLSNLYKAL